MRAWSKCCGSQQRPSSASIKRVGNTLHGLIEPSLRLSSRWPLLSSRCTASSILKIRSHIRISIEPRHIHIQAQHVHIHILTLDHHVAQTLHIRVAEIRVRWHHAVGRRESGRVGWIRVETEQEVCVRVRSGALLSLKGGKRWAGEGVWT